MKQAQKMQEDMAALQEDLDAREYEVKAGGGTWQVADAAAADLVISRAGASTLSELEAVGRASVLIPYPAAAENHQYYNAMVLGKAGAAIVIEQKDLTPEKLRAHITELYQNPEKRIAMGQRAGALFPSDTNDRIWNVIAEITGQN